MTRELLPGITWIIAKVLVLVGVFLYSIFAAVMVRQEQLMSNALEESFEPVLRTLTYIHLFAAIGIFIFGLLFL